MDLEEFVRESLTQIARGTAAASATVRKAGGAVNPSLERAYSRNGESVVGVMPSGGGVFHVTFDVALTVGATTEGGAQARLSVASILQATAGAKAGTTSESVSRIQFVVPIVLPVDQLSVDEAQRLKSQDDARVRQLNERLSRGIDPRA